MTAGSPRPPRLYAVADADALGGTHRWREAVACWSAEGIAWIQLRAKRRSDAELFTAIAATFGESERSGSDLWMDDRPDLAALFPFRGVHLGQRDVTASLARRVVGAQRWIGVSTHDVAQVIAADADPAVDVIAVGPVFSTSGKDDPAPVVGVDFVARARGLTAKPLVAIGGLDGDRLRAVLDAGADSAAVLGALCRGDLRQNARRLLQAVAS